MLDALKLPLKNQNASNLNAKNMYARIRPLNQAKNVKDLNANHSFANDIPEVTRPKVVNVRRWRQQQEMARMVIGNLKTAKYLKQKISNARNILAQITKQEYTKPA